MILFSKEPIRFENVEVICLEQEEGLGYIYLTRAIYDQCLLLNDRLEGNTVSLRASLEANGKHVEAMEYFTAHAPKPLNILAPFLGLVKPDYEIKPELKQVCGILHMLSKLIDFDKYATVPKAVRANVSFSKLDLGRYEEEWKSIIQPYKIGDIDISDIPTDLIRKVITEIFGSMQMPVVSQQVIATSEPAVPVEPVKPVADPAKQFAATPVNEPEEDEDKELDNLLAELEAEMASALTTITTKSSEQEQTAKEVQLEVPVTPSSGGFEIPEAAILDDREKEKQEVNDIIKSLGGVF